MTWIIEQLKQYSDYTIQLFISPTTLYQRFKEKTLKETVLELFAPITFLTFIGALIARFTLDIYGAPNTLLLSAPAAFIINFFGVFINSIIVSALLVFSAFLLKLKTKIKNVFKTTLYVFGVLLTLDLLGQLVELLLAIYGIQSIVISAVIKIVVFLIKLFYSSILLSAQVNSTASSAKIFAMTIAIIVFSTIVVLRIMGAF